MSRVGTGPWGAAGPTARTGPGGEYETLAGDRCLITR